MTIRDFVLSDAQPFEQYGFFLVYIIGLLYSGYGFYIVVEYYLIPACNNCSKVVTRIIKNHFLANLIMITASCMPEFFVGLIGYALLGDMIFPASIIFGCTLVNSVLLTGLGSFISLDNVVVTKTAFVRDATFFIVSVIIIYFFSSPFTLERLQDTSEAPATTYLLILLWISFFIYIMYIIALTMMSFFSKKRVYDHHFGFFGNLLNRHSEQTQLSITLNTEDVPIILHDDTVVQLHSGLLFVKSPYYTNITFSSLQWKQHWCDLFRDEMVIHKDANPLSPIFQTIPISSISKVTCDTMDPSIFILSMWNGSHTVKYTMRSNQRQSWVSYFEVLLQENNTLVKSNKKQSFFEIMQRKFTCKATMSDSQTFLNLPRNLPQRIVYVFNWPLLVILAYTIPDVKIKTCARMTPVTILISLLYIGVFAFVGVFCGYRLSEVITCPPDVLGFTFVALFLSIRHIISGWVSGRMMCANLAILNSYSMSLFFTNVAIVIPWMIYYYAKIVHNDNTIYEQNHFTSYSLEFVVAGEIFVSICHLFSTIGFKNLTISHAFGIFLVLCYIIVFTATLMTWIGAAVKN
ncbi:hypothetical protein EHI8A_041230 [Entamoeba histolytica HM-1:IMSS-B]|uniref:PH domain containing protein n=6 Tax=Entamoeba histolytica TaxID=5759 RepID=C4LUD3_ENTH1|nr:PH domain containing protein [Entamoeba histolytica HM-1:IMSS]EMD44786.1 PH domain containing protein [Entamoeba histolytica KU27]EMH73409.1 hypothetical protein EHI8A_041230 [Entamoeba histolytica HM-1:IMSS-B]EMS11134.1 hypothetical protein KM1_212040 [Entamoeba histolytica HM-3:IMSS]ENY62144.1 hypothetical protein EHI7A_042750 [Entamoeba histolytica HM-1:IMSS-A]GAT92217.1 ph domain containing protein [Entamoeba histolytica]|eukprot:XP_655856.1 PH domain containing protein [Entamoeba histolytica HM-1:IMSS]